MAMYFTKKNTLDRAHRLLGPDWMITGRET
jgi:hypothetical protein